MAAQPVLNIPQVVEDLKLKKGILEYLFSNPDTDYFIITHIDLTPTEYAGLFEEQPDWTILLRESVDECFSAYGIKRTYNIHETTNFMSRMRARLNENEYGNNAVPPNTTNSNYEANTEGVGVGLRNQRPLPTRPEKRYVTQQGFIKLPKFRKHPLYQKQPWLTAFMRNGFLNAYYFRYEHDYFVPPPPPHTYNAFSPNLFVNTNENENNYYDGYRTQNYYAVLVPYGVGFASLFVLTPSAVEDVDQTEYIVNSIRGCAAMNAPRAPVLGNVPRGARTVRRLGLLKSLPRGFPVDVFRSHLLPAVGNEHLGPVPPRYGANARKTRRRVNRRKTRKGRQE